MRSDDRPGRQVARARSPSVASAGQPEPRTIMHDIYFWTTPNGYKILLFAEETGIPYTLKPVNIGKGEQFKPEFLKISPNNRIPALVDHAPASGGGPISIFESG